MIDQSVFIGKPLSPHDPVFLLSPHRQPPNSPQAQLTMVRGYQIGEIFILGPGMNLFGRIEGRIIRDVLASRRHFQIYIKDNTFYLEDLQSTNGTFVNANPVTQSIILHHGDVIRIGETILLFTVEGQEQVLLTYGAATQLFADRSQKEATSTTRIIKTP
jgi:hypothetical protein